MKKRKAPLRKCVACNEQKEKNQLIRLVRNKDRQVFLDLTGKANGRGAYLCRDLNCLDKALKERSLERSLRTSIDQETIDELRENLEK